MGHVAINLHYLGDAIRQHVAQRPHPGISIVFSTEQLLLGTAGGAKRAASLLPGGWPLLVAYGDNLMKINVRKFLKAHNKGEVAATIAVYHLSDARLSGLVDFDSDGRVVSFIEKPPGSSPLPGWVNAGLYALEEPILNAIPEGRTFDFGLDLFPRLIREGVRINVYRLADREAVFPIDTPQRYEQSSQALQNWTPTPGKNRQA